MTKSVNNEQWRLDARATRPAPRHQHSGGMSERMTEGTVADSGGDRRSSETRMEALRTLSPPGPSAFPQPWLEVS